MSERERRDRGDITGRLTCGKCGHEKLVEDFPYDKACGWNYWCRACHRDYRKSQAKSRDERIIWVRVDPDVAEYMMAEMLPDSMAKSAGKLARKIIEDAVAKHRKACSAINAPLQTAKRGWPTRAQLMGGR